LLDRRADAVRTHDRAEFLGTVDSGAAAAFRAAQGRLFDSLEAVPLSHFSYRLRAPEPATAPNATADATWAPAVTLRYELAGVDRQPVSEPMGYLFTRRNGRWYIESDAARAGRRGAAWHGPWSFGPCRVTRTEQGMVLYHPGDAGIAHRIAQALDPAVRAVGEVWGSRWSHRVAVVIPGSRSEMAALASPEFSVDSIAAVAVARSVDTRRHVATGQRVVLNPDAAGKLSRASLRIILQHEITHIATRSYTVDGAPMWMLEGFADFVGHRGSQLPLASQAPDLAARVRSAGPPPDLPTNAEFDASSAHLDLVYQEAWSMNSYVAHRFGLPTLVRLYRAVAGAGPTTAERLADTVHYVTGVSYPDLVAGWQEYLRQLLR
jgi:hypothetical protein